MRIVTILAFSAAVLFSLNASAAEGFLADRHAARGVQCASCHAASPPSAENASADACLKCHGGSYDAVIKLTENRGDINYHDTHIGAAACNECHHGHRASSLVCSQCHEFNAKVP